MAIIFAAILLSGTHILAQQPVQDTVERRVSLTEAAVAQDANRAPALEGTLRTTSLNGAPDTPVTNIRVVMKNVSQNFYSYLSALITFYDGAGVRCGEGTVKADALAFNESFETDAPGIRIRCTAATWRIVATNLVLRNPLSIVTAATDTKAAPANLVISIDGEEHPIQLDKPMILNLGEKQRSIVVRQVP